jgi:molybdate transport system substrate-binding protein
LVLLAMACSDDGGATTPGPNELTVFAAASLTDAFTKIGGVFEDAHAGVTVTFNFGSSTDLAAQIESEGTADVFASASGTAMDVVADDPGVEGRTDFATNELVVITPPDDPAGISALEDLGNDGVQVVLAAEGVPVGEYAREALASAGIADDVLANVVSNEEDNAAVVAKIATGEADAAIVYLSDVSEAAANDVRFVEIPAEVNVIATYPIATVVGSRAPDLASAFVDLVLSSEGADILTTHGFGTPGG